MNNDPQPVYISGPIVRREIVKLMGWVPVLGAAPISKLAPFEAEILWLRESECQIRATHGGVIISDFQTLGSYHGLLSELDESVRDAISTCKQFGVDSKSSMEVEIVTTIKDIPHLEDTTTEGVVHNAGKKFHRRYLTVPRGWFLFDQAILEAKNGAVQTTETMCLEIKSLEGKQKFSGVIWNSKIPSVSSELIEKLKKEYLLPETA